MHEERVCVATSGSLQCLNALMGRPVEVEVQKCPLVGKNLEQRHWHTTLRANTRPERVP